jgi:hypothetical protein
MAMITERRKKTIELMISTYWKQVDVVRDAGRVVDLTLSEYLEAIGLTQEEIDYAKTTDN